MDHPRRPVVLQLPADPSLLRVARVTVACMAAHLPLTLQDIEDLRIAVDELAAALIDGCPVTATLTLEIDATDDEITVSGAIDAEEPALPLHPVAADLLAIVVNGYRLDDVGGHRTFSFAKRAEVLAS